MNKPVDELSDLDMDLLGILIKDGQLRMYKHFGSLIRRNGGTITYVEYKEQIEPAVTFLREALADQAGEARAKLIEYGLLKED